MTIHQFCPKFGINIQDIRSALGRPDLGLFYVLTDAEIVCVNDYVLQKAKVKKELIQNIRQAKKELSILKTRAEKKVIKKKIANLETHLNKLTPPQKTRTASSQRNPFNPKGHKPGYLRIITTPMGHK